MCRCTETRRGAPPLEVGVFSFKVLNVLVLTCLYFIFIIIIIVIIINKKETNL